MKKALICVIIFLIIGSIIAVVFVSNNRKEEAEIIRKNLEYEKYLNKEIFGTDVTTIINKAMDSNQKNGIEKDEKGFFIENDENSIKIELIMLNEGEKVTYQMETIRKSWNEPIYK